MIETSEKLTHRELAWELVDLFSELKNEQINEVLAKNVPLETLEFFANYATDFGETQAIAEGPSKQLPIQLSWRPERNGAFDAGYYGQGFEFSLG